ncbi:MAG: type VII toxin-antitoxin system HepT family RNase toxin [Desulfobacteraceae bacterium]
MPPEFSGIERRLDELSERLARLEPLRAKNRAEFDRDPYLRDIVERNLEIAAQCCLDISHRIISLTESPKPTDYYEALLKMGELRVVPSDFARKLAPLAGFRNILVHEYIRVDWDEVYKNLQQIDHLAKFAEFVRQWLQKQSNS